MKTIALFALLTVCSGTAHAQFLKEGTLTAVSTAGDYFAGGVDSRGHIYVIPNELNPEIAKPILAQAEEGAYVSVGAERGLLGALASPAVTHLVQIDLVPEVVLYNQLNVVLLKVAKNLEDFLRLRDGSQEEWALRSRDTKLNAQERALIASADNAKFYRTVEMGARERLLNPEYFKGSSYLKSEDLFAKAQKLARANRIQVLQGNLTDSARLRSLATDLASRGIPIAVLDVSNAWEEKYIGPTGVADILTALEPALKPRSIIMGTSVAQCIESHLCFWNFRGYTVALMKLAQRAVGEVFSMARLFHKKTSPAPNVLMTELEPLKPYLPVSPTRMCQMTFVR